MNWAPTETSVNTYDGQISTIPSWDTTTASGSIDAAARTNNLLRLTF